MEERIIDDEYGRGIRLKKTKDGYVDVTDSAAPADGEERTDADGEIAAEEGETGEEVTFEFPDLTEDDEDLVNLTPEEAIALRKKKEEAEARRKAEYARLCAEGDELLLTGSYKAAELKFEKALPLDEEGAEAAVGYWRAKTSDFSDPDVLGAEYAETGFESLENDLGERATKMIGERYREVFAAKVKALEEEETPLAEEVAAKQEKRREVLNARLSSARKKFAAASLPTLVLFVSTILFATKIVTRSDGLFLWLTVAAGALFAIGFVFFGVATNKLLNARRMRRANEDLSSTKEGERLLTVRAYKELYRHFVD